MHNVAIGLGSNLGDRAANLKAACDQIRASLADIRISSCYETPALLDANAPKEWDQPFINQVVIGKTTLSPHNLLATCQQIEQRLGKRKIGHWAPRLIDIDLLLYDDMILHDEALTLPHPHMLSRGFVMKPLCEIASDWLHPLHQRSITELWPAKPKLMGIINVTPDSFSDGGDHLSTEHAIAHGERLLAEGADILDFGAESTRPGAIPMTAAQEWQRLEPILSHFIATPHTTLSVDTRHSETAEKALEIGVHWINDVSAARSPALLNAVSRHPHAYYVLMHSLTVPADPTQVMDDTLDPVKEVLQFAQQKLEELQKAGIARKQIIFDPGIGFGKTAEQSLLLLDRIAEFKTLGVPVLVGHSRKSFLTKFTDAPPHERDALTLKYSRKLAEQGVDILRVHNIALHQQQ